MRHWLSVCFLAFFALFVGSTLAIPAKDVPINMAVADLAGVMSAEQREELESQLRQINNRGDMQAAVVIVPTTDGVDLFDYGMSLVDRWKLGDAQKDNGLLLLIAINDRELRFFQGYGLEGDLPDVALKRVIRDEITPYFKRGDYASGITAGMNRIASALNGEGLPLPTTSDVDTDSEGDSVFSTIPFMFFILPLLAEGLVKRFGRIMTFIGLLGGTTAFLFLFFGVTASSAASIIIVSLILIILLFVSSGGNGGGHSGGFRTGSSHRSSRRSSFGGGRSSYRGGGGGFGGGGAGGSW